MIAGLNSNWIIISVILPGSLFYFVFFILFMIIDVENSLFIKLNENPSFTLVAITACGLILQIFGMISEKIGFSVWNYIRLKTRSTDKLVTSNKISTTFPDYSNNKKEWTHRYWEKRYHVMKSIVEKDSTVERYIAQFFMAHNISVGFGILLIWTIVYLNSNNTVHVPALLFIGILFGSSIIVAQIRFSTATSSLYEFAKSKNFPI